MNPSTKRAGRCRSPRPLASLSALLLIPALAFASAWPDPPAPEGDSPTLSGEAAAVDYRFAAGLYQALELGIVDSKDARPEAIVSLARALLGQGRGARVPELCGDAESLPRDLRLLLALSVPASGWSESSRATWKGLLAEESGEQAYWLARLQMHLGEHEAARRGLQQLVRREPGSIFAPAAMELLEGMPVAEAINPPASTAAPVVVDGVRVQWGVFRDPLRARRQREAVLAYEQPAEVLAFTRDGEEFYRVCSAPFATEAEAREMGESLRSRYGLAFVLHRPPVSP